MKAKLFKIAATVLALTLAVSMTACGGTKKTAKKTSSKESASSKQMESVKETPSEEESASEEPSSEESSAQQPSSQAPAASLQTPSQTQQQTKPNTHAYTDPYGWTWEISDDQETKPSAKSIKVRLRNLTAAELEIMRQSVAEQLIFEMDIHYHTAVQVTPDLNSLADVLNDKGIELMEYATANNMTGEQWRDLYLPFVNETMAPYYNTYNDLSLTDFTENWNAKEETLTEGEHEGRYNAFDDFITGKGDINFTNLGHLYGCWLWLDGYHAGQPWFTADIENIGVSVRLMSDGYIAITVVVATGKK